MNFVKWVENKKHLPSFLRDFHDQKDLFKVLQIKLIDKQFESKSEEKPTFQQCQIIVEMFLMLMAAHGYTLQKTRTKVECEFDDIEETINEFKKQKARETQSSDVIEKVKQGKSFVFDMNYSIFTVSDFLEVIDKTINKKALCFSEKDLKEFSEIREIDAVLGTNGYKITHNEKSNTLRFDFVEGGLE